MTALLSLHWIITCKEKAVWAENNTLLILAVPSSDTWLSTTSTKQSISFRFLRRSITHEIESFIAFMSSISITWGDEAMKQT